MPTSCSSALSCFSFCPTGCHPLPWLPHQPCGKHTVNNSQVSFHTSAVDYMCAPPPQIHILKPNTQCDGNRSGAFERWLAHEGGALMRRLELFYKRPYSFCHQGHRERMVTCEWGSGPSTRHWICQTLILDFPLPKLRGTNVCCCTYPIWASFVTAAWMD